MSPDNWALKAAAETFKDKGNHIITTKIEHHAILHTCEWLSKHGYEVTYLDVDEHGLVDTEEFRAAIRDNTIIASVMFANNEIGSVQPIKELGAIAHSKGVVFHTDAVQAFAHIPINDSRYEYRYVKRKRTQVSLALRERAFYILAIR